MKEVLLVKMVWLVKGYEEQFMTVAGVVLRLVSKGAPGQTGPPGAVGEPGLKVHNLWKCILVQ